MVSQSLKSKEEELARALAEWEYDKVMSEFTAHRLLSYADHVPDIDVKKLYQAFIYFYSRNIKAVYDLLDQLKPTLGHPWFFRNCKFIANRVCYFDFIHSLYLSHWDNITDLDIIDKEDSIENFIFFFFMSGRLEEAENLFLNSLSNKNFTDAFLELKSTNSIEETTYKLGDFKEFKEKFNLTNVALVKFSELIKILIIKHNLNIKVVDYSLIGDDLLITLKIDHPIDFIHKINDDFFDLVYEEDLSSVQECLSLHFSPASEGE